MLAVQTGLGTVEQLSRCTFCTTVKTWVSQQKLPFEAATPLSHIN